MTPALDGKAWVRTSIAVHVGLLTMAVVTYATNVEPSYFSRSIFLLLGIWLVYLLLSKGPLVSSVELPRLLRYYYWVVMLLMFFFFNVLLYQGQDLPEIPVKLTLLAVVIPFAIVLRTRGR